MTGTQGTIDFGAALRDQGIKTALDHADAVHGEWQQQAYEFLLEYIRKNGGTFVIEDVRAHAVASGIPEPPVLRAWGGIAMKAAKAGIIHRVGYTSVKNPKAHRTTVTVWKRT